ncbi:hypothetical protein F5X99DRAFT_404115 [Biscogniauxia marginata]|nr:hypothetical protein F5X99DRAFT_404115 [Biscogniauxia marginata]
MSSRQPKPGRQPSPKGPPPPPQSSQFSRGRRHGQTAQAYTTQATSPKQSSPPSCRASSSRAHTAATAAAAATTSKTQPLQSGPALTAKDILSHPRLQQATGMLPRKLRWWQGVEPPRDELVRLAWVMSLPDTYPRKKPKGNF